MLNRFNVLNDPVNAIDPLGLVTWPGSGGITSGYGTRSNPIGSGSEHHAAIDIGNPVGNPVVASDTGYVYSTRQGEDGLANSVTIQHDDGTAAAYSHVVSNLTPGTRITEGQTIGNTDLSGRSTGGHIHYEFFMPGRQVDPTSHFDNANSYPGENLCP